MMTSKEARLVAILCLCTLLLLHEWGNSNKTNSTDEMIALRRLNHHRTRPQGDVVEQRPDGGIKRDVTET